MQNASRTYPTDLSDAQWLLLQPWLPAPCSRGRPRTADLRQILNGILYLLQAGCAWRLLPSEFGPWSTVYGYFRRWSQAGLWEQINLALRAQVRQQAQRDPQPRAAILDSPTIKTSDQACRSGIDAGKKIEGVKRHVLVDTLGLLLGVLVPPASMQDRDGARFLLERCLGLLHRLAKVWADSGYYAHALIEGVGTLCPHRPLVLEIVRRLEGVGGFVVLPKRWIVERTLAWLVKRRRLARHYEQRPDHSQGFIYLAMISLMLKRLTKTPRRI
jgi:putative transposase